MTRTLRSPDSGKRYFLTIDADGLAADCSCLDRKYRGHTCKHMSGFNREVVKAVMFRAMQARYDVRYQASREQAEMLARINAAQAACYTDAEIEAAQAVYQPRAFSLMR